ncbi:protein/nucleic acid deglycase dj-1-related [Holotrichia oblita]|uniref:Protein/nucleic acid deglycase dj-1-related n=2 Tax=Holotrichia oblita TaxID=644536 RepID=A0ACB9SL76_HOLOL|nr:protein/nucleic acid deglycase dj-1-related [Holotrichia oblita]
MQCLMNSIFRLKGHIYKPLINTLTSSGRPFALNLHRAYGNNTKMSKKALIFLGPGYEELEFIASADVLRRAGVEVSIAGLPDNKPVKSARNIAIVPDISICDAAAAGPFDVMVLPGGLGGTKAMADCEEVGKLLKEQESSGRKIAAICAAPTALKAHCIASGKKVTSYPAMAAAMKEGGTYQYLEDDVVVDGNIITSRGPGTATAFALTIVKELLGTEKACEVAKAMLIKF